jgi:ankyrin repeat protein
MKKIKKIIPATLCVFIMQAIAFQSYATGDGDIEGSQNSSWFLFEAVTKIASSASAAYNRLYYTYNPIQDWSFEQKVLEFYESESKDVRAEMLSFINNHVNKDNVNFQARFDVTLMHAACVKGYIDVVASLLDFGADISGLQLDGSKLNYGNTYSQQSGWYADDGSTPFHLAIINGHQDLFNFLLARGANIEETDRCGNIEETDRFGSGDSDPGRTALHVASSFGTTVMVTKLLDAGSIINALCNKSTPLDLAIFCGKTEIAEMLRERGARRGAEIDNLANLIMNNNSINVRRGYSLAKGFSRPQ